MLDFKEFTNLLSKCSNDNNIEYVGICYDINGIKYLKKYNKISNIPFEINTFCINEYINTMFFIPFNHVVYYYDNSLIENSVYFYTKGKTKVTLCKNIIR